MQSHQGRRVQESQRGDVRMEADTGVMWGQELRKVGSL